MATINGTPASDDLHGTSANDTINGSGGDDRAFGGNGNDNINGGVGDDSLNGESGSDSLSGGIGKDFLNGGSSNDTVRGGDDYDILTGATGNDLLDGGNGDDGVDYYQAGSGVNVNLATGIASDGDGGTDTLVSINEVYGSQFNDVITGSNPAGTTYEHFEGGGGSDTIDGGDGFDELNYFNDYSQSNFRNGIIANLVTGTVRDGYGNTDRIMNIESVIGTRLSDVFTGGAGNDTFRPCLANDVVDGGAGFDEVTYANDVWTALALGIEPRGITADLQLGTIVDVGRKIDTVTRVENVTGTTIDDQIRGNASANELDGINGDDVLGGRDGNDFLFGHDGTDRMSGNGGNDTLAGGTGDDYLRGGAGADTFVFDRLADYDTIRDFATGSDKMDLTAYNFANGGQVKALAVQHGADVIIELNQDSVIELANTTLAQIAAGDFIV